MTAEWIASKIGSFGENVWPATIILGGQAKETADGNAFAALDTMANVVSGNEVASRAGLQRRKGRFHSLPPAA